MMMKRMFGLVPLWGEPPAALRSVNPFCAHTGDVYSSRTNSAHGEVAWRFVISDRTNIGRFICCSFSQILLTGAIGLVYRLDTTKTDMIGAGADFTFAASADYVA